MTRRGFRRSRAPRGYLDEAIDRTGPAVSTAMAQAFAELAEQVTADPRGPLLPDLLTSRPPAPPPPPHPLVRPVGRVWHAVGEPQAEPQPSLGERLRAARPPIVLGNGRRNGRSYRRRQLRESLDGVLAIFDPLRGGDRRRPWVVIDVPPGHHTHHRDQPLADRDVQDWTVLIRATGWPRTEQP